MTYSVSARLERLQTDHRPLAIGAATLGAMAVTAGVAQAIVVETELGLTIEEGEMQSIDVNGDGFPDLEIEVTEKGLGLATGFIQKTEFGSTKLGISRTGKLADIFHPGDTVDENGRFQFKTILYDEAAEQGNWLEPGTSGYLGIILVELFDSEEEDERGDIFNYFGWLELTRGSISVGTLGLQNVDLAPAPIPDDTNPVPVPPGIALLATGAAGLAAVRRRRKSDHQ